MYKLSRQNISPLYRDVTRGFGGKAGGNFLWTNDDTVESYVVHSGTAQGSVASYLDLPGDSGDYASTPNVARFNITGTISVLFYGILTNWLAASTHRFIARMNGGGQNSFDFGLNAGKIEWRYSTNGTDSPTVDSTASVAFSAGAVGGLGVIFKPDNGASGKDTTFLTSSDGVIWSNFEVTNTTAGTTAIFGGSTDPFGIGANNQGTGGFIAGKAYRIQVYNGVFESETETLVVDFNANDSIAGASSFVSVATGETYTMNGNAALTGTGSANRIVLASAASATDDTYNDMQIILTGGTGSGQDHQRITDYDGGSKVAILSGDWTTMPDSTTTYQIIDRRM